MVAALKVDAPAGESSAATSWSTFRPLVGNAGDIALRKPNAAWRSRRRIARNDTVAIRSICTRLPAPADIGDAGPLHRIAAGDRGLVARIVRRQGHTKRCRPRRAVAIVADAHHVAGALCHYPVAHPIGIADREAVDREHDIAALETALRRGAPRWTCEISALRAA